MAVVQGKGKRSVRGSRYKKARGYKKKELGRRATNTGLAARNAKEVNIIGGKTKLRLLSEEVVNVVDPKTKKSKKVKIKAVIENPANRNFIRRNIMTKGAVIDTELGKAKITGRPGQDAFINAVLVK